MIRLWVLAGDYDLPDGIVLSVPVTFADGKWSALFDVTVGGKLKEKLQLSASELRQVSEVAQQNLLLRFKGAVCRI